jgi:hypothetical protein
LAAITTPPFSNAHHRTFCVHVNIISCCIMTASSNRG